MKFFKRKPKDEITKTALSMSTLFRWYCYDAGLEDPNAMSVKLGLTPLSPDVEDMEMKASQKRVAQVEPLLVFLNAMAEINSRVITETQFDDISDVLVDSSADEITQVKQRMQQLTHMVSFAALVSTFSSALSTGIIECCGTTADNGDLA